MWATSPGCSSALLLLLSVGSFGCSHVKVDLRSVVGSSSPVVLFIYLFFFLTSQYSHSWQKTESCSSHNTVLWLGLYPAGIR